MVSKAQALLPAASMLMATSSLSSSVCVCTGLMTLKREAPSDSYRRMLMARSSLFTRVCACRDLSQEDSIALQLPSGTACPLSQKQEAIHLQVLLLLLGQPVLERLQLLLHCPLPEALSSF